MGLSSSKAVGTRDCLALPIYLASIKTPGPAQKKPKLVFLKALRGRCRLIDKVGHTCLEATVCKALASLVTIEFWTVWQIQHGRMVNEIQKVINHTRLSCNISVDQDA